jgi:microcin C transport system substrate-binding protein
MLPCRALRLAVLALALGVTATTAEAQAPTSGPVHGFAMHGDVKYPAGFKHFDYVNPAAPKGGEVKYGIAGTTFDSFNPYILRGVPTGIVGATIETLMTSSGDEPFTKYCLVCETIEVPHDRSWVEFAIRREARFHDGSPITVDDVIWTFETLKAKGHPAYRSYYGDVVSAEKKGERNVRFSFKPGIVNRELPLIVGELPVLSKAYWASRDFEKTTLEPPLGSAAYKIDSFEAGRYVTLRRAPNYWGASLAINVGRSNFDVIRYDYYRDHTVALEAFKAGAYDIRTENQALAWATGYDSPAVQQGLIKKEEIPEERVAGMQALVMNTRRPPFNDRKFREAMSYGFDFEWSNRTLFYGAYTRTRSFFDNSELAARGLPSTEELKLLEPFRGKIPDEVFTTEYNPPKTDGTGNTRDNQRVATRLLREAGYKVENQQLIDKQGRPVSFEILLVSPQFERIVLPYAENLKRLGINARVRTVDSSQYQRRMDDFDFDMTVSGWGQSESPGNEQRSFWSSAQRDVPGSRNFAGIADPVVDAMIEKIIAAETRAELVTATRALDRLLQWGHYVVPNWHVRADRVAYWDRFSRPAVTPKVGYDPSSWWVDPRKDAALREKRGR